MKRKIITMCGSTRFADLMAALSWEFEKLGYIVLRVNYLPEWYAKMHKLKEGDHMAEQQNLKQELDNLHFDKIAMSDVVFVCDYHGYIGESTRAEIAHAEKLEKPIYYLNDDHELKDFLNRLQEFTTEELMKEAADIANGILGTATVCNQDVILKTDCSYLFEPIDTDDSIGFQVKITDVRTGQYVSTPHMYSKETNEKVN